MILQFERVRARVDARSELRGVDLDVAPGAAVAVVGAPAARATFADLTLGMRDAEDGAVRFAARAWRDLGPTERTAARGRIGCALDRPAWLSNLDVDENIVLGERYRSGRRTEDVLGEANRLCERLGMDRIPDGRPHQVTANTLRQLTVVRALLGRRDLLLLEELDTAMPRTVIEALEQLLDERRADGAAVLTLVGTPAAAGIGDPAMHILETQPRPRSERNPS